MTVEQYQNDPYAQYLKKVAKVESGGKANAKNPLSSATGLYQFTNDTWKGVVSKYNLGYSLEDRNDPQKAEKVMRLFVKDNDAIIKPVLGREVTDTDRYLTHFLGAGGASSFFRNLQKNGNAPTTSVFSNSVVSANKSVMLNKDGSPKTLSEIYGWASKKMGTKITEESVKNELIDFDIPNKLTNFAYSPTSVSYEDENESEEVKQAKESIVQAEKEQTFLEDLANNRLESKPLVEEAPEQQIQLPESNILESYGQIDQFVETPIAQQGGTLQAQKDKTKAEKYANFKKLLEQDSPVYKKKTIDEQIAEKKRERSSKVTPKDNTIVRGNLDARLHSTQAKNKTDKEIAEERQAVREKADANILNQWEALPMMVDPNLAPYLWTRENLSEATKGLESKFRISDEPNFFDDYLNPLNMIGGMASNLGQSPLQTKQTDSYLPYITSVGAPLTVGALAGYGTQNTGQFVNNLANPLAGTGDLVNNLGNKYIPNAYKLNPNAFKPNPEAYYRYLGQDGYEDAIKSGVIRPKQTHEAYNEELGKKVIIEQPFYSEGAYYNKSAPYHGKGYGDEYLAETTRDFGWSRKSGDNTSSVFYSGSNIPLTETSLYKKDWIQGYKPVNINNTNSFSNPFIPFYRLIDDKQEQPNYQQGGKYTENEIALLKELAIKDNKGQYNHPGKITQINSPSITMEGLDRPLIGISLETKEQKVMMPNLDYYFENTKNVLEIPIKNNNNG